MVTTSYSDNDHGCDSSSSGCGDNNNGMAVDDKKRHRRTEAQEWCFRIVNDPEQFVYEQTPTTSHFMHE